MSPHQGSRHILIISDYFIKTVQAIPLTDKKAATVACGLISYLMVVFFYLCYEVIAT